MNWVDYREKLGIGFNDVKKLDMLNNKLYVFLGQYCSIYGEGDYSRYLIEVGEQSCRTNGYPINGVLHSFKCAMSLSDLISKYVAFYNTYQNPPQRYSSRGYYDETDYKSEFLSFFEKSLDALKISYETIRDNDGIFVFPAGVGELDDALVSEVLDWLRIYPVAEKAWRKALRAYSEANANNASDIADLFRKALESFFKEFFKNDKSLENNKAEYGRYLKTQGVPAELSNNLESLLQAYANFMNSYAKHNDKASTNVLEYIMYQTGNTMRLLITLRKTEKT